MAGSIRALHPVGSPLFGLAELDELQPRIEEVAAKISAVFAPGTPLDLVARAFIQSTHEVEELLDAPVHFVNVGILDQIRHGFLRDEAMPLGLQPGDTVPPEPSERANARFREFVTGRAQEYLTSSCELLGFMLGQGMSGAALQSTFRSAIVQTWTAFECLATDLWVEALNADISLGHRAFDQVEKTVKLATLARYRFDLSRSLGSALRERYDFASLEGMREAYSAAFGPKSPLTACLASKALAKLAATRHLIVHRGARVDDSYRKMTGSKEELDAVLEFSGTSVAELARPALEAGYALLEHAVGLQWGPGGSFPAGADFSI